MAGIFDIDQRDLKKLMRFAKKAPTHFRRASSGVLNEQAFALMRINKSEIKKSMTVRNNAFVNSSFRVKKARTAGSIAQQKAITGSIFRPRFTGWQEQETGKKTKRNRVASTTARGGSKKGQIKPKYRMKKGRSFKKPTQFRGKNYASKFRLMLNVFASRGKQELFYMDRRYKGMRPGLYLYKRGKISKIQDADSRRTQPRRNRWMTYSINVLSRSFDVRQSWMRQIMRNLPKKL